jgi:uroporphyrin-III C-methyltransferase/precorrin-2 dehydrogenase/sirohydrochlorin ferrochelatase
MRHFPTFFDLQSRPVAVIGGTAMALQRTRLLLQAGARVTIFAKTLNPELAELVLEGQIRWQAENIETTDLHDQRLVFIATGDVETDAEAAERARRAGVPANVADRPELCDFIMPAIVERGEVTVGISTGGASPMLARSLRARIEATLPARLGELVRFAASLRQSAKTLIGNAAHRRRFWDEVLEGPVAEAVLAGRDEKALQLSETLLKAEDTRGAVYIVGAGPGDPDLLTFRAHRLMQQADIVFYDELVGPEILNYVRRDAKRVYVGKIKSQHSKSQDAINELLAEHAKAGKRVLRLKGGDPFVFGRGGEELEYLRKQNIETVVVPGITAALGCAAATGIPLTHRDYASSVTFLTGHTRDGELATDWRVLARPDQTLVVYMGLSTAGSLAAKLLVAGLPRSTPVAIVERGTRPDQRVTTGVLSDLKALAERHKDGGPALLIIGKVAALANADIANVANELKEAV